jgi:hypothetical protein
MNKSTNRRLLYLEYKLLSAVANGEVAFKKDNDTSIQFTKINGKPVPNAFKSAEMLVESGFVTADGTVTDKGINYLKDKPMPKVKHIKLVPLNEKEIEYLKILNNSKLSWTAGTKIAEKSSFLFKMVRLGYAVGSTDHGRTKLNKNDIMPIPDLVYPENRLIYHFKITKKGKEFLKDLC